MVNISCGIDVMGRGYPCLSWTIIVLQFRVRITTVTRSTCAKQSLTIGCAKSFITNPKIKKKTKQNQKKINKTST